MAYKRLTKKNKYFANYNIFKECEDRLRLLEDKIENGTLVFKPDCYDCNHRGNDTSCEQCVKDLMEQQTTCDSECGENKTIIFLPFKVGQTCFMFQWGCNGKINLTQGKINQIIFNSKGIMIRSSIKCDFYLHDNEIGNIEDRFIDRNFLYLCSEEQAKERLKKLQGEQK